MKTTVLVVASSAGLLAFACGDATFPQREDYSQRCERNSDCALVSVHNPCLSGSESPDLVWVMSVGGFAAYESDYTSLVCIRGQIDTQSTPPFPAGIPPPRRPVCDSENVCVAGDGPDLEECLPREPSGLICRGVDE